MNTRLLVVDDAPELRKLLKSYLSQEGYEVEAVPDGVAMDAYLERHPVDLLILDLMLPGEDGLSIGRRIRQHWNLPIIILSARGDDLDRIVGLEMGADDYLTKPFNPRELLARIRSVLRRCQGPGGERPTAAPPGSAPARFGPFRLDVQRHKFYLDDAEIPLTTGEFRLMRVFAENANRVLSRETLLRLTRGYDPNPFDRSIDVCVGRLRKKIEPDPAHPQYLRTIRGVGYIFSVE